jgi:uncharacterized protein (TIGR00266 family)
MKYDIVGSNMQHLNVSLDEGEKIFADSGTFVSKTRNISMTPKFAGGIISAIERKVTGAEALMTVFEAKGGSGEVAVAGLFPGKVFQVTLKDGEKFTVEKYSFLAADASVKYGIQLMGAGAALFGGAGLYLLELVGPGNAFIHVVGDIIEHDVTDDDPIEIDPGHIAGFDSHLKYAVSPVDNIRTAMFGGVGLFLAKFEGNGRLITHSVSRYKLSSEIYIEGLDQHKKR